MRLYCRLLKPEAPGKVSDCLHRLRFVERPKVDLRRVDAGVIHQRPEGLNRPGWRATRAINIMLCVTRSRFLLWRWSRRQLLLPQVRRTEPDSQLPPRRNALAEGLDLPGTSSTLLTNV